MDIFELSLHFSQKQSEVPILDRIVVFGPSPASPITAYRAGPPNSVRWGRTVFQWTNAVKALTLLLLRTAIQEERYKLIGERDTPASSLDFALTKQPRWLHAIFGTDSRGASFARSFINRQNSERKRPGPVELWINTEALSPAKIRVLLNGVHISESAEINSIADEIQNAWSGKNQSSELLLADLQDEHDRLKVISTQTRLSVAGESGQIAYFARIKNISSEPVCECLFQFEGDALKHKTFEVTSPERSAAEVVPLRNMPKGKDVKNACRIQFDEPLLPEDEISLYVRYPIVGDPARLLSPIRYVAHHPTEHVRLTLELRQAVRIRNAAAIRSYNNGREYRKPSPAEVAQTPEGYTIITWAGDSIRKDTSVKLYWEGVTLHERAQNQKEDDINLRDSIDFENVEPHRVSNAS